MRSRFWIGIKSTNTLLPDDDVGLTKDKVKQMRQELIALGTSARDIAVVGVYEEDQEATEGQDLQPCMGQGGCCGAGGCEPPDAHGREDSEDVPASGLVLEEE